jgi:hypothetical protein
MKSLDILNTVFLLLGGSLVLYVLSLGKKQMKVQETLNPKTSNIVSVFRLNPNIKYRALLPYIFAQAYHETGNFKSNIFITKNNMFGMKKPNQRPFVGSKNFAGEYMYYNTPSQSLQDFMLWLDYTGFPSFVPDVVSYVAELKKRSYFEDTASNYINGMNRGMGEYNKLKL